VLEPGVDAVDVTGVSVVDGSGVEVAGVAVGRDKPGRVGGRVEVINGSGVLAGIWGATLTQDARTSPASIKHVRKNLMK
jgi:hypothetical protein